MGWVKVRNSDREIEVYYEEGKMYTDSLKYGKHLEIIWNKETNCFTIKNLEKLREEWRKNKGKPTDNFERFIEEDDGMQDL